MSAERSPGLERLARDRPDLVVIRQDGSIRFRLGDDQALVFRAMRRSQKQPSTGIPIHPAIDQYLTLGQTVSRGMASFRETERHRGVRRQDTERLVVAPGQVLDWPRFITRILPEYTNLKHIDLSGNRIGAERAVGLAGCLPRRLRSLVLRDNRLGDRGVTVIAGQLSGLSRLEVLDLGENRIRNGGASLAAGLAGCPALRSLGLGMNDLDDNGITAVAGAFQSLTKLETLNLSGNRFGVAGTAAVADAFRYLPVLRTLDLSVNSLGSEGAAAVADALRHVPVLTSLDLSSCEIETEGAMVVAAALPALKRLARLAVASNGMEAAGAAAIVSALPPSVRWLDLSYNQIEDEGVEAVAGGLGRIKELDLSGNGFTDEGIAILVPWLRGGLRSLALGGRVLGAGGVAAVATTFSAALVRLDLSGTYFGAAGARTIAGSLYGLVLTELDLSRCNLGPHGTLLLSRTISSLERLTSLDLSQNKMGSDGAVALARALPACRSLARLGLNYNRFGLVEAGAGTRLSRALRLDQHGRLFGMLNRDMTGIRAIAAALRRLPEIVSLDLAGNFLYDEGAVLVAASVPRGLAVLDLSHNRIGRSGVRRIAEALGNRPATVFLRGNDLEGADVELPTRVRFRLDWF
ncbi:hypothetical protein EBZ80_05055 [bacterium]|nr:hypothetical protein [bacterium]